MTKVHEWHTNDGGLKCAHTHGATYLGVGRDIFVIETDNSVCVCLSIFSKDKTFLCPHDLKSTTDYV